MQLSKVWLSIVACLIVLPSTAFAQGSITGTVRDTSGAVLPGVTVEASSDALIEKARSAVTDGSGQYRIVDLRAGTYSVTFTLTGFNTFKREGVEIAGYERRASFTSCGTSTPASAARFARTPSGSSSSSATKAVTGPCQGCLPTRTWATRRNGRMWRTRLGPPSRLEAGETERSG